MERERTRVLIVNTTPFGPGGIRKVIVEFYKEIDKNLFSIDIVSIDEKMNDADKVLFADNNSSVYVFKRKENVIRYMSELYKLCKRKKYKVMHVHGNSATMAIELFIARVCGIEVRIAHCHTTKCDHTKVHNVLLPIFRKLYTHALACSSSAGNWIFGEEKFEVIKNAMNLENYSYNENIRKQYRNELSIPDHAFLLGHVGFFNETKNQEYLIDILYHLAERYNVFLMLIGTGRKLEYVYQKAVELNVADRVFFMSQRDDVNMLLQAMDLFVFPSKWEGLGLALVEAQLTGLYCIASTGVPKEANISEEINYISLSDPEEWENRITMVLDNLGAINREKKMRETHKKMKEAGYDIKMEIKKLETIYQRG